MVDGSIKLGLDGVTFKLDDLDLSAAAKVIANAQVTRYLAGRIEYLKGWCMQSCPSQRDRDGIGATPVARLRDSLSRTPVPRKPSQITVEGAFFPAVLLYSGWWERERRRRPSDTAGMKWHDDLQAWLFNGFEQWAPSWDLNPGGDERYLFGQIGEGDEADSLPVIVPPSKAARLRDRLAGGAQVFGVKATGLLCHRQHIQDLALQRQIAQWGRIFDYCLLLSDEEPAHRISPVRGRPDMYSGYLWQCWAPRKWITTTSVAGMDVHRLDPPRLNKIYFLWEHTDFTKPDAVSYNLDSLEHKARYLGRRHEDELVLLQKSSALVPGDQVLPQAVFYQYIAEAPVA